MGKYRKRKGHPIGRPFQKISLNRDLLEGDDSASSLELLLGSLCVVLGGTLENVARSGLDESLGLLEAQRGDLADNLDDSDLVVAERLENNVEIGLLLGSLSSASSRSSSNGDRSSSGDAELFLEVMDELGKLESSQTLDTFKNFFLGHVKNLSI